MVHRLEQRSSADLRKLQLVDIACDLINREGLEAVKHSTLAELAGCTRALVYRYFPKKADILIAISEAFFAELDGLIDVERQQQAVTKHREDEFSTLRFLSIVFDLMERRGIAATVISNTPALSAELASYESKIHEQYQRRWLSSFAELGIEGVNAELLLANCSSIMANVHWQFLRGKLSRRAAIKQAHQAILGLVQATSPQDAAEEA